MHTKSPETYRRQIEIPRKDNTQSRHFVVEWVGDCRRGGANQAGVQSWVISPVRTHPSFLHNFVVNLSLMTSNIAERIALDKHLREDGTPDVRAIMAEIRARVREELSQPQAARPFQHQQADFNQATRRAGETVNSEELRHLNIAHSFPMELNLANISSHRFGLFGKILVAIKRKFKSMLWQQLLKDYFSSHREFNAQLVRHLNDLSRYVDARDASNFWELIKKIDVDVTKALERVERVSDDQGANILGVEKRVNYAVAEVRAELSALRAEVQQFSSINGVVQGLEGIVARLGASNGTGMAKESKSEIPDLRYLLLENRFRGKESEISGRVAIYPEYFKGVEKSVLEIGAGRGELQRQFKTSGIPAYGVDLDRGMVEAAIAAGADVRVLDGIAHLRELEDGSLGGVIAIQVVEHLPLPLLRELIQLCRRKVCKGGRVIFETINPRSLVALSSNYFRDLTHVFPLHPDTLAYELSLAGLVVKEVRPLSPIPQEAKLQEIPQTEFMSPRWTDVIELLNRNLRQLNELVYGDQDFCIVAEV